MSVFAPPYAMPKGALEPMPLHRPLLSHHATLSSSSTSAALHSRLLVLGIGLLVYLGSLLWRSRRWGGWHDPTE